MPTDEKLKYTENYWKRFITDQTNRCTSAYKIPTDGIYYGAVVLDCVGLPDEMVPRCVWDLVRNIRKYIPVFACLLQVSVVINIMSITLFICFVARALWIPDILQPLSWWRISWQQL